MQEGIELCAELNDPNKVGSFGQVKRLILNRLITMATQERRQTNPIVVWVVVGLVAVGVALAIRSATRERLAIRVASASYQNLISTVSTNGKVEPIHEFQAHAAAPGVVEKIYVEVGDVVKPGQLLVKMDDSDVRAHIASSELSMSNAKVSLEAVEHNGTQEERMGLSGDIDRARLQLQQDKQSVAALKLLQQKGAASASEVGSAQERLAADTSTLNGLLARSQGRFSTAEQERARQQVANARAEQVAALSSFAGANVRSPIAGTVYSVPVSEYDYVAGGEDLVFVADLNQMQVRAYFDEPEIGKLAEGQAVKIVWDAKPDRTWHGHIYRAPTTVITYGTRNVGECLITVDDAKGDLLPNTNVTVTVTTREDDNVLSIPREALHTDGARNYVFRVVDKKLVRTPVELGVVSRTLVEVTRGLSPKDVIALSALNNSDLADGLPVKPVK